MPMIGEFLNYLRLERAYSLHTVTSYGGDLLEFEAYLGQTENVLELKDANADLVRSWAMHLMASGKKPASVNRKLSSLRSFYKYLLKKGVIDVSPMQNVRGPKRSKPLPQFIREDDMERMLRSAGQDASWQEVRELVILQLFYETGIRLSELVGLDDGDIDFGRVAIKVTGKRNKQRIIPIGQGLSDSLKEYMEARDENMPSVCSDSRCPLFVTDKGARVYPHWIYRLVHKKLSQVVTLKKKSPHVLRHTFATAMLNNEAELGAVKELMGHASVSTTQIYTHTTFEELKKAYSKAHPRASINQ